MKFPLGQFISIASLNLQTDSILGVEAIYSDVSVSSTMDWVITFLIIALPYVSKGNETTAPNINMDEEMITTMEPPSCRDDSYTASGYIGHSVTDHEQVVACYVGSWAYKRPSKGKFTIEDIDPMLCTHLIYAFVGIDNKTFEVISLHPEYDEKQDGYLRATSLKQKNPNLSVTVAVGGFVEGRTDKYSRMVSTRTNRMVFIDSVLQFIKKYKFDGLDLDWEYPVIRTGKKEDKDNLSLLAKEIKAVFGPKGLLLTAAVTAVASRIDKAYDLTELSKHVDYINAMTYNYHGHWSNKTGHVSPLHQHPSEYTWYQLQLNVHHTVRHLLSKGVPSNKLVLGLALYSRTFALKDELNTYIGAGAIKDDISKYQGPYTRENGVLGYNEICEKQTTEEGWKVVWQREQHVPYMYKDKLWAGFEDENSLLLKVEMAQRLGLAGIMVWSIDFDDFRGECGQGKYPMMKAINRYLAVFSGSRYKYNVLTASIGTSVRPQITSPIYQSFVLILIVFSLK